MLRENLPRFSPRKWRLKSLEKIANKAVKDMSCQMVEDPRPTPENRRQPKGLLVNGHPIDGAWNPTTLAIVAEAGAPGRLTTQAGCVAGFMQGARLQSEDRSWVNMWCDPHRQTSPAFLTVPESTRIAIQHLAHPVPQIAIAPAPAIARGQSVFSFSHPLHLPAMPAMPAMPAWLQQPFKQLAHSAHSVGRMVHALEDGAAHNAAKLHPQEVKVPPFPEGI
ncbi:MAG: hypothetical protein M1826_007020 [Phylliscum demangeonii]|nr:MAG: hypothetical protein M1826_007020 [Phylliscum demangeonii]